MTIKEPPNEEGKPKNTRNSVRGQDSGNDPGAVPVFPLQPKSASSDEDKKQRYKLEHAEGTAPFAPPMRASRPTEQEMTDRDLEAKARARNTTKEGVQSTPGATPVFPKQSTTNRPVQDPSTEPSSTVHDGNMVTENEEIRIPEATTVEDAPLYAHAYVQNDVENNNGDGPPTKTESPKRCTPGMRYGLIAGGVLVAIVLIVTLSVVFAGNRYPAVAPTPAPTGKAQYVQYQVVWITAVVSNATLLSTDISDLELACLSGGSLKLGVVTSFLEGGESPVCTKTEGDDTKVRCTQAPVAQSIDGIVLHATISFQCRGTSVDELVGQAELFDTTLEFDVGESGETSYAAHLVQLQAVIAETTARDLNTKCSDVKLSYTIQNAPYIFCGDEDICTNDGVNQCVLDLEGRSEVQRDPINEEMIQDA